MTPEGASAERTLLEEKLAKVTWVEGRAAEGPLGKVGVSVVWMEAGRVGKPSLAEKSAACSAFNRW